MIKCGRFKLAEGERPLSSLIRVMSCAQVWDNQILTQTLGRSRKHWQTPEAVSAPIPPAALPPLLSAAHMPHSPLHKEPAKTRHVQPEPLDREKKRRRLLTSDHTDSVNINRNVMLPLANDATKV
jgi:hypothetical protein